MNLFSFFHKKNIFSLKRALIFVLFLLTINSVYSQSLTNENNCNPSKSNLCLAKDELDYIKSNPIINVVINPDWFPYEYISKRTKEVAGLNVAILKHLCSKIGLEINFIKTESYDESIELIKNNKADLITGNLIGCENIENLLFTDIVP